MTAADRPDLRAEAMRALDGAWVELTDEADRSGEARTAVPLSDEHILLVGLARPTAADTVVDTAAGDGDAKRAGRLVHDVNNALGGMLAHLYLALADLEAGHPARPWVESVNDAVSKLRERMAEVPQERG